MIVVDGVRNSRNGRKEMGNQGYCPYTWSCNTTYTGRGGVYFRDLLKEGAIGWDPFWGDSNLMQTFGDFGGFPGKIHAFFGLSDIP